MLVKSPVLYQESGLLLFWFFPVRLIGTSFWLRWTLTLRSLTPSERLWGLGS